QGWRDHSGTMVSTFATNQDCRGRTFRAINSCREMLFKALSLRCQCGRPPIRIRELGLTADHELAVYWQCAACRRPVYAVKPLRECWAECPKDESSASPLLRPPSSEKNSHD